MIKFFRQSYAIQYVAIAALSVALWIPTFASGKAVVGLESPVTPLFNFVAHLLGHSSIAQHVLAFVLLIVNALFFNTILVKNQIIGKVGTMGAFVFVLLMSLTRTQTNFYPFLLSMVFILLSINLLYGIYLSQSPELDLLKTGMCVALASLCYFPSILLIIWVMVSLPVAKKSSLRLELIPLTGFLSVYFFYFVGMYLFGDFLPVVHGYRDWFLQLKLSVSGFNLKIVILLFVLLFVAVLLLFGNSNLEKTLAVRVKISMSVILMAFSVPMLFFGNSVLLNGLIFIALSIVISYEFSSIVNTGWANLLLSLFLLLVFANHYYLKLL